MIFTAENILLIGSVLIFTSILISKTGYRFGIPTLLLFLLVGMLFGSDGLGLQFNSAEDAQFIGMMALSIILFTGGMETKFSEIKPVLKEGIMLSTVGVLLTTLLTMTGVFAVMNGVVPAIAQDEAMGVNMGADIVSFATLTPYALLGLCFGPVAGILASKFGYHKVLRGGLVVSILGALFGVFIANSPSVATLVVISVVLGIAYAGTANIMLNGLGIVLSLKDNPGYLPGMNAGAFNLGAGLSYAVLYAVMNAITVTGGSAAGYAASMIAAAVLLGLALLSSFLIPKESQADES